MSKSRHSKYNYRLLDRDYTDGEDYRQEHRDKSRDRRFQRALKTRNIREMVEINDDYMGDYELANLQFPKYQ